MNILPIANAHNNPRKDSSGKPRVEETEAGILWSHKDTVVKWIAKLSETGDFSLHRAPITDTTQ